MSEPFLAEIRVFPFTFAPRNWAWCNGQLLPIAQNTALFALLGTVYGGNGQSTFALPDLQGRVPMHPDQGSGLSLHQLGEMGGAETVTLLESEIPAHTHSMLTAASETGEERAPGTMARSTGGMLYGPPQNTVAMAGETLAVAGGSQPHNNMQPYLTLNFNIALAGIFPPHP